MRNKARFIAIRKLRLSHKLMRVDAEVKVTHEEADIFLEAAYVLGGGFVALNQKAQEAVDSIIKEASLASYVVASEALARGILRHLQRATSRGYEKMVLGLPPAYQERIKATAEPTLVHTGSSTIVGTARTAPSEAFAFDTLGEAEARIRIQPFMAPAFARDYMRIARDILEICGRNLSKLENKVPLAELSPEAARIIDILAQENLSVSELLSLGRSLEKLLPRVFKDASSLGSLYGYIRGGRYLSAADLTKILELTSFLNEKPIPITTSQHIQNFQEGRETGPAGISFWPDYFTKEPLLSLERVYYRGQAIEEFGQTIGSAFLEFRDVYRNQLRVAEAISRALYLWLRRNFYASLYFRPEAEGREILRSQGIPEAFIDGVMDRCRFFIRSTGIVEQLAVYFAVTEPEVSKADIRDYISRLERSLTTEEIKNLTSSRLREGATSYLDYKIAPAFGVAPQDLPRDAATEKLNLLKKLSEAIRESTFGKVSFSNVFQLISLPLVRVATYVGFATMAAYSMGKVAIAASESTLKKGNELWQPLADIFADTGVQENLLGSILSRIRRDFGYALREAMSRSGVPDLSVLTKIDAASLTKWSAKSKDTIVSFLGEKEALEEDEDFDIENRSGRTMEQAVDDIGRTISISLQFGKRLVDSTYRRVVTPLLSNMSRFAEVLGKYEEIFVKLFSLAPTKAREKAVEDFMKKENLVKGMWLGGEKRTGNRLAVTKISNGYLVRLVAKAIQFKPREAQSSAAFFKAYVEAIANKVGSPEAQAKKVIDWIVHDLKKLNEFGLLLRNTASLLLDMFKYLGDVPGAVTYKVPEFVEEPTPTELEAIFNRTIAEHPELTPEFTEYGVKGKKGFLQYKLYDKKSYSTYNEILSPKRWHFVREGADLRLLLEEEGPVDTKEDQNPTLYISFWFPYKFKRVAKDQVEVTNWLEVKWGLAELPEILITLAGEQVYDPELLRVEKPHSGTLGIYTGAQEYDAHGWLDLFYSLGSAGFSFNFKERLPKKIRVALRAENWSRTVTKDELATSLLNYLNRDPNDAATYFMGISKAERKKQLRRVWNLYKAGVEALNVFPKVRNVPWTASKTPKCYAEKKSSWSCGLPMTVIRAKDVVRTLFMANPQKYRGMGGLKEYHEEFNKITAGYIKRTTPIPELLDYVQEAIEEYGYPELPRVSGASKFTKERIVKGKVSYPSSLLAKTLAGFQKSKDLNLLWAMRIALDHLSVATVPVSSFIKARSGTPEVIRKGEVVKGPFGGFVLEVGTARYSRKTSKMIAQAALSIAKNTRTAPNLSRLKYFENILETSTAERPPLTLVKAVIRDPFLSPTVQEAAGVAVRDVMKTYEQKLLATLRALDVSEVAKQEITSDRFFAGPWKNKLSLETVQFLYRIGRVLRTLEATFGGGQQVFGLSGVTQVFYKLAREANLAQKLIAAPPSSLAAWLSNRITNRMIPRSLYLKFSGNQSAFFARTFNRIVGKHIVSHFYVQHFGFELSTLRGESLVTVNEANSISFT